MCWRQKLRALWLRKGDKKTKIFHMVANFNRRNNTVDSLVVNGSLSSNSTEMREHIAQFYNRLYLEQLSWRPNLDGLTFTSIGDDEILCVSLLYVNIYTLLLVNDWKYHILYKILLINFRIFAILSCFYLRFC